MKIGTQYDRVAIFDVDGTLMNIEHRRKYVTGEKKDWKSFFDYMEFDTIRDDVFHLAHALHKDGYVIIVCSDAGYLPILDWKLPDRRTRFKLIYSCSINTKIGEVCVYRM